MFSWGGKTEQVVVRQADVVTLDESAGRAVVAVDLVETVGPGTRHYVGTWALVRGPAGWLLDQPNLRLTP
jgi:hypothetical protein